MARLGKCVNSRRFIRLERAQPTCLSDDNWSRRNLFALSRSLSVKRVHLLFRPVIFLRNIDQLVTFKSVRLIYVTEKKLFMFRSSGCVTLLDHIRWLCGHIIWSKSLWGMIKRTVGHLRGALTVLDHSISVHKVNLTLFSLTNRRLSFRKKTHGSFALIWLLRSNGQFQKERKLLKF